MDKTARLADEAGQLAVVRPGGALGLYQQPKLHLRGVILKAVNRQLFSMPKYRIRRFCRFRPKVIYFKPRGVPMRHLGEVILAPDELEAVKLADYDGLNQTEAATKMRISQPTLQRILASARKKVSKAIIEGKSLSLTTSGKLKATGS